MSVKGFVEEFGKELGLDEEVKGKIQKSIVF